MNYESLWLSARCALLRQGRNAHGATLLASLTSEFAILYSNSVQVRYAPLVLRTRFCKAEPPWSSIRRLACAWHRLARSLLSAPKSPFGRLATQSHQISLPRKKQKDSRPNGQLSFWRGRRDLNSRAGKPDLHP